MGEKLILWQYFKDPNDVNEAILTHNENWEGITADNIINITFDTNHMRYVVFWRAD